MNDLDLLPRNNTKRKIIHVDMDAFYASVEQRDNPELKTKALVIAHDPRKHHGHGVITTANYVARQYGVNSAMPAQTALENIPRELLVFVEPDFTKYREISRQIHEIMYELTDVVESVALDEAYLDVTTNKLGNLTTIELATYLQQKIFKTTHLTSSVGISYNKFLAKMASEYAKPFGRSLILPTEAEDFLASKDIKEFPGIGKKTQEIMYDLGINTGLDLRQQDIHYLMKKFKKAGYLYAQHARGIDLRAVKSSRTPKSIGKERTFEPNLVDRNRALNYLRDFAGQVSQNLQQKHLVAKTVMLKIRDKNFNTVTKQTTLKAATNEATVIYQEGMKLFDDFPEFLDEGIRLLGISANNLVERQIEEIKLPLFTTR